MLPVVHDGRVIGSLNLGSYSLSEMSPMPSPVAQSDGSMVRVAGHEGRTEPTQQERWLAENLDEVVWTMDLGLRVIQVSPSVKHQIGRAADRVVGQLLSSMMTPESARILGADLFDRPRGGSDDGDNQVALALDLVHQDGSTVPVEFTAALMVDGEGRPIGMLAVTRDIGQRRRLEKERAALEQQLRHAQKMAAVGTLVVGVAHDFNNLLTAILGCASVMKLRGQSEADPFAGLDRIESAAQRASELTRQLLGFARKSELRHQPVELYEVVDEVISLLEHTIDRRIRIEARSSASHLVVMGDRLQLEQVVLNLALNAIDAMPQGGELTLSTRMVVIEPGEPAWQDDVSPGRYVVAEVIDSGIGVPEEIRQRIFEPFFTTKPPGKGTGMGLAVAYGIVKSHGGAITVSGEPAQGTKFTVYLPAVEVGADPDELGWDAPTAGEGRVLIVDDERMVRESTGEVLRILGYDVSTAGDGREALATYQAQRDAIDLVILDLGMPGVGGGGCLRSLLALDPEVRVLVSTGLDLDGGGQSLLEEGAVGLLQKPYTVRQLGEAVATALRG